MQIRSMMQEFRLTRFSWYWVATLCYCLVIFGLSAIPKTVSIPSLYGVDKVLHVIEYGVLGFLIALSLTGVRPEISNRFLAILILVLATLYGISDEIHQSFVPGRSASVWDVLADSLGGLLGAFFYIRIVRTARIEELGD